MLSHKLNTSTKRGEKRSLMIGYYMEGINMRIEELLSTFYLLIVFLFFICCLVVGLVLCKVVEVVNKEKF